MKARAEEGRTQGPLFTDKVSGVAWSKDYEIKIIERLQRVQDDNKDLILTHVSVAEEYGISRSFRRGATTEARNQGVAEGDIDAMNRWRNFENARGRRPRLKMQDHYSNIKQMTPTLLRFSQAL